MPRKLRLVGGVKEYNVKENTFPGSSAQWAGRFTYLQKCMVGWNVALLQFLSGWFDFVKLLVFSYNPSASALFGFLENQLGIVE